MLSSKLEYQAEPRPVSTTETLSVKLGELKRLCVVEEKHFNGLFQTVEAELGDFAPRVDYARIPNAILAIIIAELPEADASEIMRAQRHVVANLLTANAERLMRSCTHAGITSRMRGNFDRMATSLLERSGEYADYDYFLKDINYVCGEFLHCGAELVSLTAKASPKALFSSAARKAYPSLLAWARPVARLGKDWFRMHLDTRMLGEFNEAGFDDYYKNVAALLQDNPRIFGMIATSWQYDPQVLSISPRLAHIQSRPLERGAFLFRHGPGAKHTAWAIEKSATRRKLVEDGTYIPQCYSLLWPRAAMCEWAGV